MIVLESVGTKSDGSFFSAGRFRKYSLTGHCPAEGRLQTPRFRVEIARQSVMHSRGAGGALTDGKTAINGLSAALLGFWNLLLAPFSGACQDFRKQLAGAFLSEQLSPAANAL